MKASEHRLLDSVQQLSAASEHLPERVARDGPVEACLRRSRARREIYAQIIAGYGWQPSYEQFAVNGDTACNVMFHRPDSPPNPRFRLTCHTDYCAGDGTNDNTTGMAVTAEVACLLAGTEEGRHVSIAGFDMEERGLLGSRDHVKQYTERPWMRPARVVNVDAISGNDLFVTQLDGNTGVVGELISAARKSGRQLFPIDAKQIPISSDHLSFTKMGIEAATLIGFSQEAHEVLAGQSAKEEKYRKIMDECSSANKPSDTLKNLDPRNMVQAVRILLRLLTS